MSAEDGDLADAGLGTEVGDAGGTRLAPSDWLFDFVVAFCFDCFDFELSACCFDFSAVTVVDAPFFAAVEGGATSAGASTTIAGRTTACGPDGPPAQPVVPSTAKPSTPLTIHRWFRVISTP